MTLSSTATFARSSTGTLRAFGEAGILESADVHVATRLGRLGGETDDQVLLAAALAVRAVRHGSVCLDLSQVRSTAGVEGADEEMLERLAALEWPDPEAWLASLRTSGLVAVGPDPVPDARPLRLVEDLLYLDRYWRQELVIAEAVDERRARPPGHLDQTALAAALKRLFPDSGSDRQRLAAAVAAHRWVSVLAGGPGTGKTTTVAKLLAVLRDQPGPELRIALAAPTGKAAARLEEAVTRAVAGFAEPADRERLGLLHAMTLHRLLGWKPGARTRFKHDRDHRLPFDVVVVDEASMVSLTLMARLVEALPDDARLLLVGDPDQLASVEAGAVLGDLVRRPAPASAASLDDLVAMLPAEADEIDDAVARTGVVTLTKVHRVDEGAADITTLARAINAGDADLVLELLESGSGVELLEGDDLGEVRSDVVTAGLALSQAARAGDGRRALVELDRHRVLCAHRLGPFGVASWGRQVEEWLREADPSYGQGGLWYVGRPLLVTSNDPILQLYNGDTGVVVEHDGQPRAVFARGSEPKAIATNRLAEVTTVHAMSVHKSQGSEFERVTVVLPEPTSPLLTKELFYTAVTRAKQHVRVIGSEEAVRTAVGRRIQRASGLARSRT
ncbi:MAG TPA: exodeoxyribonuclease V subunit alpha [Nocardioidaceae bacterium]|nr:exodeoxyribonuclease V subunit alpha [Nocardioidaceae bacterium]